MSWSIRQLRELQGRELCCYRCVPLVFHSCIARRLPLQVIIAHRFAQLSRDYACVRCSISAKNLNNIDITMEWLVKHAKNPSS